MKKVKNKGGRPPKYSKEILKKTNKFFLSYYKAKPYINVVEKSAGKKITRDMINPLYNEPPYIEMLSLELDIDDDTINEWARARFSDNDENERRRGKLKYPEFSATIKKIKTLQKIRLLQSSLDKRRATGSIFQLKVNHNMVETQKRIVELSDTLQKMVNEASKYVS